MHEGLLEEIKTRGILLGEIKKMENRGGEDGGERGREREEGRGEREEDHDVHYYILCKNGN